MEEPREEPRENQESLQVVASGDPTATPVQTRPQDRTRAPDPYPPPAPPPPQDPAQDRAQVAPAQDPAPAQAMPGPQAAANHVYALGRIEPRFPTLGVEKEWAQLAGRSKAAGLTDREAVRSLLARRENRYLAREMCWVLTVEGLETYLLRPRDPADFKLLIKSLRAAQRLTDADVDVVIGTLGPVAPPEMCNGLTLPICLFDQLYCFDADSLIRSIPPAEGLGADQFEPVAKDLFLNVVQLADNAGATDEHRALNYLSVRYPAIYHVTARRLAENAPLSAVEVDASRLGAGRRLVDVILAYRDRTTDVVDKYYVRVDVTEKFPFLVSKLAPYVTR